VRLVQIKRAAHEGRKVVTKNEKGEQMKKNRFMKKGIKLKNNNRRRLMLKRCHQKVLQRRKLFVTSDMFTQLTRTPG